jgi:hypothetical protein
MSACKNGAHDWIPVLTFDSFVKKFAFEIVTLKGVDGGLKGAITDCCLQSLNATDDGLVVAALWCLAGIGKLGQVSVRMVESLLKRKRAECLWNCAFVTIANWAAAGPSSESLAPIATDLIAKIDQGFVRAVPALLSLCRCGKVAVHVLNKLPRVKCGVWIEFYPRLLMVMQFGEAAEGKVISRRLWERDRISFLGPKFADADRAMRAAFERLDQHEGS